MAAGCVNGGMRRGLLMLVVAAGCGERGSAVNATPAAFDPATPSEPGLVVHPGEVRSSSPAVGSPHSGDIVDLVLSGDGRAALTVDVFGGARLWPDLDAPAGTEVEPVVVPVRDSRRIALGGPVDARIVVAIDGAGMARVLRFQADRSFAELATTPPTPGLLDVDVLADGKHLLLLTAEHVVQLASVTGEVLATLDERGYRPEALQLDAGGLGGLAVSFRAPAPPPNHTTGAAGVRRFRIDVATRALAFEGDELEITGIPAGATLTFAPAGDAVAFLAPREAAPEHEVIVVDLPTLLRRTFGSPLPFDASRTLGFIDRETLVAARGANGTAWRIDANRVVLVAGAPTQLASKELVGFATRRRVSALGTTLMVQKFDDTGRSEHYYLGYKPFSPQHVAVSPSGARIAWLSVNDFYFESADGKSPMARIANPVRTSIAGMRLLDDDHLLIIDSSGGLHVLDGRDGSARLVADTGIATALLAYDHVTRVLVIPTSAGARVFTVEPSFELAGPYLIGDGAQVAGVYRDPNAAARIWTRDPHNVLRHYSLAEVRAGLSRAEALERGDKSDPATLYFGDVTGRLYGLDPTTMTRLFGYDGAKQVLEVSLSSRGYVAVPAYGGQRFMALVNGTLMEVFDRDGTALWSRAPGGSIQSYSWSADGSLLATASPAGGAVWRGADGEPVLMRCGVEFGRTIAIPHSFGSGEALMCGAN